MLTRGLLIGQIVDDLSGIAAQARQRALLHLFDIHTHVEDFICEVLNRVLHLNLSNLNAGGINHPGLDLGDASAGWAFQVTTDKSSAKVKSTLEKVTDEDRQTYKNIRIMVIGSKQGSYSFTGEPYDGFGFTADMVWDFDDVCAKLMSLPLDEIADLARYVAGETQRVRMELEIPDENGVYPTSIDALVEALPKPRLSDAAKMEAHFLAKETPIDRPDAEENIKKLSGMLARLPRQTREVFRMMVERREKADSWGRLRINDPSLRRIYRADDLDGDLELLSDVRLIDLSPPDDPGLPAYWELLIPGYNTNFHLIFLEYASEAGINLNKPLVALDYSDF